MQEVWKIASFKNILIQEQKFKKLAFLGDLIAYNQNSIFTKCDNLAINTITTIKTISPLNIQEQNEYTQWG